eukprot:TRINITY_DN5231_c0_g1_i1.p2 TRINITY_DN5231_c0_g1~~TRINITY_DN5231_c0_g1_i1.p2  ORF type:complete len:198 (+),score=95.83 TRINITY_DN5231_c0_g1_i1:73-666(+)
MCIRDRDKAELEELDNLNAEECKQLKEEIAKLETECEDLRKTIEDRDAELEASESKITEIELEHDNLKDSFNKKQQEIGELSGRHKKLQQEIIDLEGEMADTKRLFEKKSDEFAAEIVDKDMLIEKLREELKERPQSEYDRSLTEPKNEAEMQEESKGKEVKENSKHAKKESTEEKDNIPTYIGTLSNILVLYHITQ